MKRATVVAAVVTLVAACGASGASETTTSPESRVPTTSTGDSDSVLLTVTSEGGFAPVGFGLDRMPRFMLMEDGRLIFQGPIPEIYPGPILPNVQETTVSDADRDEIERLIEDLGLAKIDERIDDTGAQMIADATTEFITYYDENGAHRLGIYALGLTDGVPQSTDRLLATEVVEILDEATATGEATPYAPDRLQVAAAGEGLGGVAPEPGVSGDDDPSQMPGGDEPELGGREPWPLQLDFDEMPDWGAGWRCVEVKGDDVPPLLDVFAEANQATLWGDDRLSIRARPLLPGETACEGAGRG